ncbi:MAG: (Fe-S)-binding protein, partial [Armatimonadetes bacterium]|nr:(Fe-S)-binding protein [Armatimonadota bacterium]
EMYYCLGCLACQTACPAGVPYGKLLEQARTQIEEKQPGSFGGQVVKKSAFFAFERVGLLRFGAALIRLYQRSGLRWLARKSGLLRILPKRMGEMEGLLPELPSRWSSQTIARETQPEGEPTARVGILLGCVMDVFCAPENEATVRVLTRQGNTVVAPKEAGCCGALHAHAGNLGKARDLAKRVIEVFEAAEVDAVVLNSAGCGAAMKDYGHWFEEDPEWAERAAAFSARVFDLTEWLARTGLSQAGLRPLGAKLTYHDACHLCHAQGVATPPRDVLAQLPGIDYAELPEANWCCGSAGIYNVTHLPESLELLDRKVRNIASTGASIVVTGNPGCLLQLRFGLKRRGLDVEAVHTAVLLDRAYGGEP